MGRQKRLQKLKRRRKRGLPTREWMTQGYWEDRSAPVVYLSEYTISFEPIRHDDGKSEALRRFVGQERMEQLYSMAFDDPAAAVPELSRLLEEFPHVPILYNWLGACYGRLGEIEKHDELATQNYFQNPEYLFARVDYAALLLGRGEIAKAAEVFNSMWDLKMLYPHRKVFHISEFLSFSALVVQYMMRTGNLDAAENFYETMLELAPDHDITLQVKKLMNASLLLRLSDRLRSMLKGQRRRTNIDPSSFTSA